MSCKTELFIKISIPTPNNSKTVFAIISLPTPDSPIINTGVSEGAILAIIDFILSNMTNSGIENIGIFTKNKSRSLVDHLTNGRPWDLNRKKDGLRIFNFGDFNPQYDDVHNFLDNIDFFEKSKREYVLLSPSYMVCNIDYNDLMKYHKESGNDVTVVYKNIKQHSEDKFVGCQVLNLNDDLSNGI